MTNSTIVFIDESGDSGFALEKGSSEVFVISCIVFEDELEAEKVAVAIKGLRRKLGFSDAVEFKFSKSSYKVRKAFLQTVEPFSFKIRLLVVDKNRIRSSQLRTDRKSFYSYFIKIVLKNTKGTILNAKIRIDGSGDRVFRRQFLTYLRKALNTREQKVIKNIKLVNSKSNVLIQMADMIAGATRRHKDGKKKDFHEYWRIIEGKVEDCWDFK